VTARRIAWTPRYGSCFATVLLDPDEIARSTFPGM
jgi:hypothetical protein